MRDDGMIKVYRCKGNSRELIAEFADMERAMRYAQRCVYCEDNPIVQYEVDQPKDGPDSIAT